jgi:hypothetical protein
VLDLVEVLKAFRHYQDSGFFSPFTCGNVEGHEPLHAEIVDRRDIKLFCVDCNYEQEFSEVHKRMVLQAPEIISDYINDPLWADNCMFKDAYDYINFE